MNNEDECDNDSPENAVWPPPIRRDDPPTSRPSKARRETVVFWTIGLVLNMAGSGHKDFPESLSHNLGFLTADLCCWLVTSFMWWKDVRAEWRGQGSPRRWQSFGHLCRERMPVAVALGLCTAFGLLVWVCRTAASDFW